MKLPNLDRAFGETPACVHAAIEAGFRDGLRASFAAGARTRGESSGDARPSDETRGGCFRGPGAPRASGRERAAESPALRAARAAMRRRRLASAAGVAAALALVLCAALLSTGRPAAPRPDRLHPVARPNSGAALPGATASGHSDPAAEVYATSGGLYYHAAPDCSGMQGARALTAEEAEALGKQPCPLCIGAAAREAEEATSGAPAQEAETSVASTETSTEEASEAPLPAPEAALADSSPEASAEKEVEAPLSAASIPEGTVYATDGGRYFHTLSDCRGMENARAMSVAEALKLGKAACPSCIDPEAPVYATGGGRYFHVLSDCSGMENARAMTVAEALKLGKATCPNCIGAVEVAFATDGGRYYHAAPDCSGMENAHFTTVPAAEAQGKSPCPNCIGASASNEAAAGMPATQDAPLSAEDDVSVAEAASGAEISISVLPEEINVEVPEGGASEIVEVSRFVDLSLETTVYTSGEAPRYHADPGCSILEDAHAMTVLSALALGKSPCPDCTGASVCVYTARGDSRYHFRLDCSGLEGARATALETALRTGLAPCAACVGADGDVYATGGGVYCHTEPDCSGMRNAKVLSASRAGLLGKTPCPVCMAQKPELARTVLFNCALGLSTDRGPAIGGADDPIFYYTANGRWFHLSPDCSGMRNAGAHALRELFSCGKKPCPACFPDEAARELYRIPAPEGDKDAVLVSGPAGVSGCFHRDPTCFGMQFCYAATLADARDFRNLGPCSACLPALAGETDPIPCVVDADGAYYHLRDDCPRLGGGAQETTRLQAQASGRMHCPDCAALSPDGADKFEALFGRSLSEVSEGYSYERTDLRADGAREWFLSDGAEAESLGLYAPDGAGGGTLTIGCAYDGDVQPWSLPPELLTRAREPLPTLYQKYASDALRDVLADSEDPDGMLASCRSASLRFDADCNLSACMLIFGDSGGSCTLGWEADGSGGFQLAYRRCTGEGWTQAALQEGIGS